MERVEIGSVPVFRDLEGSKAQALKPLEEAAEVFGAWQKWQENGPTMDNAEAGLVDRIVDECCDAIQACVNLAAAYGVRGSQQEARQALGNTALSRRA